MNLKWFRVPGDIVFGQGSLSYLSGLKGKKAMLVTGGQSMKKHGFLDQAQQYLEEASMEVAIIDGVEPDPSIETVIQGGKRMADFQPDWIVAIGGGSALDAAKIMWVYYEQPDTRFQDLIEGKFPPLRNKARFVTIPSTSGTASEITAFSVITDRKNHIKYPLVSYQMTPDIAILDANLPAKMPAHITANTGMDVMAHALEALVSTNASSYTDALATEAIRLVFQHLATACKDGQNMEAREAMHNASAIAGMAFTNSSLGIVHSMAHKIGGEFGVTHGLANGILMPYVVEYNKTQTHKYKAVEQLLGIADLAQALKALNQEIGIPLTFNKVDEVSISDADFQKVLDRMSQNALADPCSLTNPRKPDVEAIKSIYQNAYQGLSS